jgi:hypothetical protein
LDLIPLAEWLKQFPEVSLATPDDSSAILELFNAEALQGRKLSLCYDRSPDYFAFLRSHSPHFYVFMIKNQGRVEVTSTLVIRPGMIQGERRWVGYLGDLRVTNPRQWGRYWRRFYRALMLEAHRISEFKRTIHWQTCLLEDNPRARRALVQSQELGYRSYSDYQMINLLGKLPSPSPSYLVQLATRDDLPELKQFWQAQYQRRDFGYVFAEDYDELEFRLKHWPDCQLQHILLVRHQQGHIIGACLLWSPSQVKKIIVQHLPPELKLAGHLIRMFIPWPQVGEELRCLYPTLLQVADALPEAERQAVARALFSSALAHRQKFNAHVVSVAAFTHESWQPALAGMLKLSTKLELLTVDPLGQAHNQYNHQAAPGFEMALV